MTDQPSSQPQPAGATAPDGAAPAAEPAGETLVLTPPPAVAPVAPAQAERSLSIDPKDVAKLDALVDSYIEGVTSIDVQAPEFRTRSRTSASWATTTSARRPRCPTRCSTSRWRRCATAG